jgi:hypothetical protein
MDDCPVATGEVEQLHACEECGLEKEGYYGNTPEYDDAPYGCPRCGSTQVVFDARSDIPEGQRPKQGDPLRKFYLCLACKHEGPWAEFQGHKDRQVRSNVMTNPFSMGHLIEGTVEQDPKTGQCFIRTEGKGAFDVQAALLALKGKDVRFTLVSFENLQRLAELVENQGSGQVMGVQPTELGVPFDVRKKD